MKSRIKVKGMHCASCEMLIKDALEEIEGISDAELDHVTGDAEVDYDESKIDLEKIKAIIKEEGYEVGE